MILEYLQNFNQNNRGDASGTLWATKNIDPELNPGKINISKIMGYATNTDDQSNLEAPAWGITYSSLIGTTPRYFAVADDRCWESASANPDSPWTEMASTPTDIDSNSDIIAFNSKIYIATQNNLKSFDGNFGGGTFANISGGLGASPHSMTIYANRLYVSDLNDNVYSMNTSETLSKTGSNTINLNTATGELQIITKIATVSNGIWIATVYSDKAGGEMIFWDGETANVASERYMIPRGALSMTIVDDRPYVIDSLGRLRVFDGTTFTEIARLPIKDEALSGFNDDDNSRFIHPNGMIRVNEEIYVLVSNKRQDTSEEIIENMPSGIWAYHKDYGFYHKYSFSEVDLNSVTLKDYGCNDLASVGALFRSDATGGSTIDTVNQSEVLAGIQYYSDATATKAAIGITDVKNSIQKSGYLVTAQVFTETFDETWKEIIILHDKFKNSTDSLVIKFRTSEDTPVYGTATWSSDNILRSSTDLSNFEQDDEIEILRGNGSGLCATIKQITHPNDYRITLIENPLSGMSGTCRFRAQKWITLATQDVTDEYFLRSAVKLKQGAWVQFKLYMVGTGMSPQLIKAYSVSERNSEFK